MAAAIGYVRGMFQWTVKREGIIAPDERPPAGQSVALGVQHIFAMFGATVLAPVIMGFNPNTAIFFSGIGTLIFFVFVRGRVPSYLGSSFSFIAVVISAEAIGGGHNIPVALGGIIACGAVYAAHRPDRHGGRVQVGRVPDAPDRDRRSRRGHRPQPGARGHQLHDRVRRGSPEQLRDPGRPADCPRRGARCRLRALACCAACRS